jgi:hypothetical protein
MAPYACKKQKFDGKSLIPYLTNDHMRISVSLRESLRASHQETERALDEMSREVKEASRIVGNLGNKFGELPEHLVAPNIAEKFNALGYGFTCTTTGKTLRAQKRFLCHRAERRHHEDRHPRRIQAQRVVRAVFSAHNA